MRMKFFSEKTTSQRIYFVNIFMCEQTRVLVIRNKLRRKKTTNKKRCELPVICEMLKSFIADIANGFAYNLRKPIRLHHHRLSIDLSIVYLSNNWFVIFVLKLKEKLRFIHNNHLLTMRSIISHDVHEKTFLQYVRMLSVFWVKFLWKFKIQIK